MGWSLEKNTYPPPATARFCNERSQNCHPFHESLPRPSHAGLFSGRSPAVPGVDDRWHGMCILQERIKKYSHFVLDIVNCVNGRAKPGLLSESRSLRQEISESIWFVIGWIRGAGRIGHRPPSSVRVAFDGAHWPAGNGNFSTHGSHARFVVRWESYFPLVFCLPAKPCFGRGISPAAPDCWPP